MEGLVPMAESSNRKVLSLAISPEAHATLKRLKHEEGINQVEIVSRLIEWFADQVPAARLKVLRHAADKRRMEDGATGEAGE